MNTSKIVLGIVLYVIFCGQACFSAAASDVNGTKTSPSQSPATSKPNTPAKTTVVQQQPQVIVQQQYVRDPSFDKRTSAIEQNQRATEQQIATLRQDLSSIDADLRAIFEQNSKSTLSDTQIGQKLDRIEKLLGTMNGRIKKLEDRVDRQEVKLRKLKNDNSPAPETKESPDPNQPTTVGEPNQP